MSNSVTVTVQLDGGSSASRNFDLGTEGVAPAPPDAAGEDAAYDAQSADAPPPAIETTGAALGAGDLPPPDFDDDASASEESIGDASGGDDSPPPPDA